MRVALISDIHGNLVSLEAVLADIAREQVDQIVCLGDVVTFGSQPRQVLERLRALGCPCVMGNHDLELLDPDLFSRDIEEPTWILEMIDWCAGELSVADLDYMRSFQPLVRVPLDAEALLLCFHGSPSSNMDFILATTQEAELDEMLAGHTATVMAAGHTHVHMLRRYGDLVIVNAGSVGWPLEQMPFKDMPRFLPWAEYAAVSWEDGILDIELRRVPTDVDEIKRRALANDMPGAAEWAKLWRSPVRGQP